jgi:histone deacetylase 1/2
MDNLNTEEYLAKVSRSVIENIKHTTPPSVQMTDVPRESLLNGMDSDAEDEAADLDADQNPDVRDTQLRQDKAITRNDEFDDSDEELEDNERVSRRPREKSRITDFVNPYGDPGPEDDFLMTGANGQPDAEDSLMKDDENGDAEDDAVSMDSPRPARSSLSRPQLWSTSAPEPAEGDDDGGDEMEIDDEDDADEDRAEPAKAEDEGLGDDEDDVVEPVVKEPSASSTTAAANAPETKVQVADTTEKESTETPKNGEAN